MRSFRITAIGLALASAALVAAGCGGGGGGGGGGGAGGGAGNGSDPGASSGDGTVAAAPPQAPATLTAFAGDAQVGLAWVAATTGGSASAFKIYRGLAPGFTPTGPAVHTATASEYSFVDSGLSNFTPYYYVVIASNAAGDSPPSGEAQATPVAGLPGQPASLSASGADQEVDLTWSAPAAGGEPLEYRVYRGTVQDFTLESGLLKTVPTSPTSSADSSVTNFTTYYYVVTAANPTGEGIPSAFASAIPNNGTPGAPKSAGATAGNGRVDLAWQTPDGGDTLGYRIYRSDAPQVDTSASATVYDTAAAGATGYADTGVTNFTTYFYRVVAENPVGSGPDSAEVSAMPNDGVPGQTGNLGAAAGDAQVTLTWDTPSGGTVTEYRIFRGTTTGFTPGATPFATVTTGSTAFTDRTYVDGSVTNFSRYYYLVIAANPVGAGAASDEQTALPNNGPPGATPNLAATAGNAQVTLSWDAPGGGTVFEYRIYRAASTDFTPTDPPYATLDSASQAFTDRQYVDSGVTNFSPYYYRVVAANPVGSGTASGEANAIPNDGPLGTPALGTNTTGSGTVTLNWSAPTSGGTVTEYRIYRSTSLSVSADESQRIATVQADQPTTYTDSGLTDYQDYWYVIAAANPVYVGTSTSAFSEMPGLVPAGIGGLQIASGTTDVTLTWNAPDAGGPPVTRYDVFRGTTPGVSTGGSVFGNTTGQSFVDSPLTPNSPYFYKVVPHNLKGDGPATAELTGYPRTSGSEVTSPPPTESHTGDQIGRAVALSGDTALIGAPTETRQPAGIANAGGAYLYVRNSSGTWSEGSHLQAPGTPTANAQFGHAVAISGDWALVGAPGETKSGTGELRAGRVSVFHRSGTTWSWHSDLDVPDVSGVAETDAMFGSAVAIDGGIALVSAIHIGPTVCGQTIAAPTGMVFAYELSGDTWTATTQIAPPASDCLSPGYYSGAQFGFSAAVSGNLAVIGAPNDGAGVATARGSAYFFKRDTATGAWGYLSGSRVLGNTTEGVKRVGWSVAISGTWAAIGQPDVNCFVAACGGNVAGTGVVSFHQFDGTSWSDAGEPVYNGPPSAQNQWFGDSVAITPDRAVVAAFPVSGTTDPAKLIYRVFTCTRSGSAWSCATTPFASWSSVNQALTVTMPVTSITYGQGLRVAADQDNSLVGIPFADANTSTTDNTGDFTFY